VFVLGAARLDPRSLDLAALRVRVWKNDQPLSEGLGSAVQGSPLASVAWLANTLGSYGVTLDAGDVILSGSLVPLEPARPGDSFRLELEGVGGASINFVA
jgi:2-oxopent-4-enoate/cis-2-oxohex-4-enoate hydratase